jgi:GNAT superfamily N-acetyltransferase
MTPFADIALARRIESSEARLSEGVVRHVARTRPSARGFVETVAGGVAAYGGPGSPFNKLIGAGFDGPPDEARLAEVEAAFFERGSPVQAEVATLASPAFHAALTRRGYLLQGFENVLGLAIDDDAAASTAAGSGIDVSPCGPGEFQLWLDLVVAGFEQPDASGAGSGVPPPPRDGLVQVMNDMTAAPGFHRQVARLGGEPAGGASMRLDEAGIAQLAGAATLPAFRRRGVQRALLAARLAMAARAGCDLAVVTTQPGSQSQANAERQGFRLLYARAVLVKDPPLQVRRG